MFNDYGFERKKLLLCNDDCYCFVMFSFVRVCVCVCVLHICSHTESRENHQFFFGWLYFSCFVGVGQRQKTKQNKTSNEITSLNEEIMISYIYFHFT